MKKITIAALKRQHKIELADRQKIIDRMEQRKAEMLSASQSLIDQWAMERLEHQRALQKVRDEIRLLYTIRNG